MDEKIHRIHTDSMSKLCSDYDLHWKEDYPCIAMMGVKIKAGLAFHPVEMKTV